VPGVNDTDADGTQAAEVKLSIDRAQTDSAFKWLLPSVVDVAITDNEPPSPTPSFERAIFYHKDASLENGLTVDNTGQRSLIHRVQIRVNGNVNVPQGTVSNDSFELTNLDTNTDIELSVESSTQIDGQTHVVLTFNDGTDVNGSLIDGNYRLSINGLLLGFDADGSGSLRGTRTIDFHRLYGDTDGDRDVDATDYGNFYQAYFGNAAFTAALDQDDDNNLFEELGIFFANYGKRLDPIGG
jgi:hypothetical protein